MCSKEWEQDHSLQHAWRGVISALTTRAINFVNGIYNGNPIYVTNPYVYYRNIEVAATYVLAEQVLAAVNNNDINQDEGYEAIRKILSTLEESYAGNGTTFKDWNPNGIYSGTAKSSFQAIHDAGRYTDDVYFGAALVPLNKGGDIITAVSKELEDRKEQIRAIESQKLAWGRGFFPLEYCGSNVFSNSQIDIRTCITFTPGAVVQDLTTWILSSALRQMELADEYEEWVSGEALAAMNQSFGTAGVLGINNGTGGSVYTFGQTQFTGPIGPDLGQAMHVFATADDAGVSRILTSIGALPNIDKQFGYNAIPIVPASVIVPPPVAPPGGGP